MDKRASREGKWVVCLIKKKKRGHNAERQVYIKDKANCSVKAMWSFQLSLTGSVSPACSCRLWSWNQGLLFIQRWPDRTDWVLMKAALDFLCVGMCVCAFLSSDPPWANMLEYIVNKGFNHFLVWCFIIYIKGLSLPSSISGWCKDLPVMPKV